MELPLSSFPIIDHRNSNHVIHRTVYFLGYYIVIVGKKNGTKIAY